MANGAEIAKAYIQVLPTTKDFKSNLMADLNGASEGANKSGAEAGSSFLSGFGSVIVGISKVALSAIAAGAAAVSSIVSDAVREYANYEQLVGGVETLFNNTAAIEAYKKELQELGYSSDAIKYAVMQMDNPIQTVMDNAAVAYKTAGLSANEYMETVTGMAAALNSSTHDQQRSAEYANMAIIDMSDNANKMGTSMESIQNAYSGFAKQNYTMLDNLKLGYGGTKEEMKRLLEDAEAISGVHYDINNYADVVEAIHVVQTDMGITGTTAEEAATTISGSTATMKAAWDNLLVGIADDNADFSALLNDLVTSIGIAAENILPRIAVALQGVGQLVSQLAPLVAQMVPQLVSSFLPPLLEASALLIQTIITSLPELLEPLITDMIPVVVDLINTAIPILIEAILELAPMLIETGFLMLVTLVEGISESLPTLIPQIVNVVIEIVNVLINNASLLIDAALKLLEGLADGLIQAIPVLIQALPTIIENIVNFLMTSLPKIMEAGKKLLSSIIDALPEIIKNIVDVLPQIIESIIQFLLSSIPMIIQTGLELLVSLVSAMPDIIIQICNALPAMIDSIIFAIVDNIDLFIEAGVTIFVALVKNMPQITLKILEAVAALVASMITKLENSFERFVNVGKYIIEGIWQGIKDTKDWLINKVKELCEDLWESICDFFDINSPSREMAWIGEMIDRGLGTGISKNADIAIDSALGMSEDVMEVFDDMNTDLSTMMDRSMSLESNATLDITQNESAQNTANALLMLQNSIDELNARLANGFELDWDDRNLGRLVQTYA